MRVAVGRDIQSDALLGFVTGYRGTATTAPTATTFTTDGVNIPANSVVGRIIATGTVFGIIQSNTSAASSVLTIGRWYDASALPATAAAAAAATPAAGAWQILPGNAPGAYMALTASTTPAVDGDTALAGEIATAGGGLIRSLATYAHTPAGTTTTLVKTFTANASDALPVVVAQIGIFQGVAVATSRMIFRTLLNATMSFSAVSDQGQVTESVVL